MIAVLLALLLLQALLLSSQKVLFGYHGSPLFVLFTGLAIGILPLSKSIPVANRSSLLHPWLWLVPLLGILLLGWEVHGIIHRFILDPKASDIIPSLQHMYVDRVLAGEKIYKPYYGFGYEFHPTYLPLFWMPYVVSGVLKIDHRWMAFALLVSGLVAWHVRLMRQQEPTIILTIKMALPWLVAWWFIRHNPDMIGYTVEAMVAGYFIWFVLSMLSDRPSANGFGLILTLLSRYANLLFVPLYAIMGWKMKGHRSLLQIAGMVILGILLLYVVPFLSTNWQAFGQSYQYYTDATLIEWRDRPDLGRPYHLYNGVGMAFWYYTWWPGDLEGKIAALRYSQMALCLLSTLLMGIWIWRKSTPENWRWHLLLALQVYFAVFYSFVQIPYAYLYIVPLLVGVLVVTELRWSHPSSAE